MARHRRGNTLSPELAVYLDLKDKGHLFENNNVHIVDREDRWFKREVMFKRKAKCVYVHVPS